MNEKDTFVVEFEVPGKLPENQRKKKFGWKKTSKKIQQRKEGQLLKVDNQNMNDQTVVDADATIQDNGQTVVDDGQTVVDNLQTNIGEIRFASTHEETEMHGEDNKEQGDL